MGKMAVFRIRLITSIILLIGLILVSRLYYIQVVNGAYYTDRAERQYVHTASDLYSRGSIYFTTKSGERVSAATVKAGSLVAVNPELITDPAAAYDALSATLTIDRDLFILRATLPNRTYVEIEDRLDTERAASVVAADIPGVMVYRNQWRYYPGDSVSARSIGFVGYSGDQDNSLRGRYGLERYYDDVLFQSNETPSVNFFAEIFSNLGSFVFDTSTANRGSIVTTIEPTVARILDQTLQKTNDTYGSSVTGGIIINPQTGEIYALNAVPTFDNNNRSGVPIDQFRNPLVENVYEMGSIVKALTLAAGLDAGAITPSSTYYDEGFLNLNTFTIRNFDGKGRGTVDMQAVINQSLNTGVSHIVQKMGKDSFRDYFSALRLGSETGIDLPNEAPGLVGNLQSPRDVEYATASFGQGIAMTPIAITRALAALGNGGHLITPHLVSRIEYIDGTHKDVTYPDGTQVFTEETSETVSRMLVNVVDDALRGGTVALPDHTIAAKTGTAQIADPVNGGYYDDRYLHSFFGYFPAYEPQFLVFLYTVEPQGVQYASETLTEPFMDLTKFLINYYNVPPDR